MAMVSPSRKKYMATTNQKYHGVAAVEWRSRSLITVDSICWVWAIVVVVTAK